jgi:flagellar hook-basal body complex protein FliE
MAIAGVAAAGIALPTLPTQPATGAGGVGQAGQPGQFGGQVAKAMQDLDNTNKAAEDLAVKAATGDLQDAHDFMIASTRANLATELTVAVRNRAVESFQSVMNMGI